MSGLWGDESIFYGVQELIPSDFRLPKGGFGPSDWLKLGQGKGSFGGPKRSDARGD